VAGWSNSSRSVPAHTRGDVIVHVPEARTVFTGDILFVGGTPIVWAGPLSNWIAPAT
jgi:cyclase